jgi:hypothetical protein
VDPWTERELGFVAVAAGRLGAKTSTKQRDSPVGAYLGVGTMAT